MNVRLLASLLIILTTAVSASAAGSEKAVIDAWNRRMQETVTLLKAQDHRAALRLANRTVSEMVEMLGPGDAATAAFGLALVHKALAHAGLGEEENARWYWQVTVSLYPQLANDDLSMFGAAGEFLKRNTTPAPPFDGAAPTGPISKDRLTAPKHLKFVKPDFPSGANSFKVGGDLTVEVVITPEGGVRSPRIITPLPAPTLSYAALEAVKKSRYRPGTIDGKPVPVIFRFTVNFKPR